MYRPVMRFIMETLAPELRQDLYHSPAIRTVIALTRIMTPDRFDHHVLGMAMCTLMPG